MTASMLQIQENLLSSVPGGIAIYRLKQDGRVATEYVSESLAQMCGYKRWEFLEYLRHNALVNLVPEDVGRVMSSARQALDDNTPISVVYRIYTKDKQIITIRLDANLVQDIDAEPDDVAVICGVHTTVTEASLHLEQERERYRRILDTLDLAYFEWRQGEEFFASPKYQQYLMSRVDNQLILQNKGPAETIHPDDLPLLKQFFAKIESKAASASATLRCKMIDGSFRWTEMMAFFDYDEQGKACDVIGVLHDVEREWARQNARLQEAITSARSANEAKTNFLSRISHDMRTPLNGILGLTALLRARPLPQDVMEDLTQVDFSGRYLLNLINDTIDVSKIELDKLELRPTVCSSRSAVDTVVTLLLPQAEAKLITVNPRFEGDADILLFIDVGRLEQVMMNIFGNAVKFTPRNGTIDLLIRNIALDAKYATYEFSCKDSGIGISDKFLPHIFEPFSQENNSSTSAFGGTGLGMTISKRIIELMGGEIKIESVSGKGTNVYFVLSLPLAQPEQIAAWHNVAKAKVDDAILLHKRVLLCEDNKINASIVERLLCQKGTRVDLALNGQAGVDRFVKSPTNYYDAILMDIRMPILDGIGATKAIRASEHPQAKTIPVIALTANALSEDVQLAKEAGIDAYLSKPLEPEQMFEALKNCLAQE